MHHQFVTIEADMATFCHEIFAVCLNINVMAPFSFVLYNKMVKV